MSISTKGYLLTPVKDVALVLSIVERIIDDAVQARLPAGHQGWTLPKGFQRPESKFSPTANMASTVFEANGQTYMVMTHFGQDEDDTHPGEKIIFQMYRGQLGDTLIPAILEKVTFLGECYYQENDDRPPDPTTRMDAKPMTFMDAVVNGCASSSGIRSWIRAHKMLGSTRPLHDFLGITTEELEDYIIDHDNVWRICAAYKTRFRSRQCVQDGQVTAQ